MLRTFFMFGVAVVALVGCYCIYQAGQVPRDSLESLVWFVSGVTLMLSTIFARFIAFVLRRRERNDASGWPEDDRVIVINADGLIDPRLWMHPEDRLNRARRVPPSYRERIEDHMIIDM